MTDRAPSAAVIGAGEADAATAEAAEAVGAGLARAGFAVVTGGLGGVMEAAHRGARAAGGHTVAILPGHDRAAANPHAEVVVTTGMGEARNLAVVSSGQVVVAVGGEWGTLSEIGLARRIGRPVVVLGGWRLEREGGVPPGICYAADPGEAVSLALAAAGG